VPVITWVLYKKTRKEFAGNRDQLFKLGLGEFHIQQANFQAVFWLVGKV